MMEREVQRIAGSLEALIWAIGCVWGIRVEHFIRKRRPGLNSAMFFIGLYVTVSYLLTHLAWYGMAPTHSDLDIPPRGLLKLLVFLSMFGVMAASSPGDLARRIFGALAFPFFGLLGLLSVALGFQVVNTVAAPQGNLTVQIVLCGPIFGVIVAALLSLPCTLLYRAAAVPVAALALVPAISKQMWLAARPNLDPHPDLSVFGHLWPFICSCTILAIFCAVCRRWVTRRFGESEGPWRE